MSNLKMSFYIAAVRYVSSTSRIYRVKCFCPQLNYTFAVYIFEKLLLFLVSFYDKASHYLSRFDYLIWF